jgi:2-keto-4-pentenoate hydratase/2-oxohepta-3-ene-1,7-dioic acid hydratase in catechol pathway
VDDSILGFTGLNNIWVKDAGTREAYVRPLRVYDNCCPTGPLVNTELDGDNVRLRLWVDGELRQDDIRNRVTRVDNAAVSYVVSVQKWLEMQQAGATAAPTSFS